LWKKLNRKFCGSLCSGIVPVIGEVSKGRIDDWLEKMVEKRGEGGDVVEGGEWGKRTLLAGSPS
jgi:hypothetical protein